MKLTSKPHDLTDSKRPPIAKQCTYRLFHQDGVREYGENRTEWGCCDSFRRCQHRCVLGFLTGIWTCRTRSSKNSMVEREWRDDCRSAGSKGYSCAARKIRTGRRRRFRGSADGGLGRLSMRRRLLVSPSSTGSRARPRTFRRRTS